MQPTFKAYLLFIISLLLWVTPTLNASQESDFAYSLGVQSLTESRFLEARDHFQKVVRLDPNHKKARYYYALVLEKLAEDKLALRAVQELTAAPAADGEVWLLQGILQIKLQQPGAALKSLERAQQLKPKDANTYYYRGVAQQQLGEYQNGLESMNRAVKLDPSMAVAAHYFSGIAYLGLKDEAHAIERLEAAKQLSPGIGFGLKAEELLSRMENEGEARPPWSASASIGFEYDSNVLLEPDSIEISEEDDFRGVVFLGGRYVAEPFSAAYSFYQSQHLELDDFNVQSHRLAFEVQASDQPLQYGARANSSLALITNSLAYYSWASVFEPYLLKKMSDHYTFGMQGKIQYIDFRGADDIRDNLGYGLTGNQLLQFFENRLFLGLKGGLQFEDADREYDLFKMSGEGQIGLDWLSLFWSVSGGFDRTVYFRNALARQDHRLAGSAGVSKKWGDLNLSANYQYSNNESNLAQFTYLRHIASLNFSYAF